MSELIYALIVTVTLLAGWCIIASFAVALAALCFTEVGQQVLAELRPLRFGWRIGNIALAVAWQ